MRESKPSPSKAYEGPMNYSFDIPDIRGGAWNISFTPRSNEIYITSPDCFYLNVLTPQGEIFPYRAEDASGREIKTC